MDADDVKDLEKYIRDKRRAEAKCNLSEVAQLCNCIGEIYSKYGRYEDAVQEHSQERYLSETLGDKIGEAVACRKIGENLCSQGLYKEALELQKKHLTIARECGNHLEEQRAWATIGRTYLSQAETKNIQESTAANKKAEKAFVKALEACDNVKASVKPTEYMSMKGRIYLNLGLVFDLRGNLKDSADMMKRAVIIAEKFKLYEESYLCHGSLASLYHKGCQFSPALRSLDVALTMAEKLRNKVWERETYIQKATVLANCADFLTAKHCLKKAHKIKVESDVSEGKLVKMFQCVNKMQEASQDLPNKTNEKELAKLYEVMADSAAEIGNFTQAIENYLKVLEFSSVMSKNERADIYVSLAQSYADIRQYDNAIFYYNKELEERKDDSEQACRTYLNIAELKELQGTTYSSVCKTYLSAYDAAKKAKHTKLQVQTLKSLTELQRTWKQTIHLEETQRKLTSLIQKQSLHDNSDSEEEEEEEMKKPNTSANKENNEDGNLSLSDLTVSEESDSDNGTLRAENKKKFVRRNEKGETALHRACIDGNLKKVKSLVGEGHPVNPRDFCGWLPIHEACNHGHVATVEYLLEAGAWINDRGGERCGGVTPLIDAANCGHLEIVKLLVEKGAQVMARDDDGNTALDCLRSWYSRTGDVLELADEVEYKKIEKMLQNVAGNDYNPSNEPGTSKTRPLYRLSAQKGNPATSTDSPKDMDNSLLSDFLTSEAKTGSKSKVNKLQKGALNERLRKLREKRECKTASRTTRVSEVQECLTSSDEEPADVYRSSQLLSSASNQDLPGSEVYRLAINSVGRSSAHRAEAELDSDISSDTDTIAGNQLPSLVNAEEDVGDDWLVNDLQWPQAKKKSSAVTSVLTTSSSRSTAKKRLRNDMHTKKSDHASKRHKHPISDGDKQTERMSVDDNSSAASRTGSWETHESVCAVSSTTEMVPRVDEPNQPGNSRDNDFEWDSDDDLLCQIDTVYEAGNKSITEIASSQNDSMSISLIDTSSPITSREIPAGHMLQPNDGRFVTTGHFQCKPFAQLDDNYRSGSQEAMPILNSSDNRNLATGYGQDSVTGYGQGSVTGYAQSSITEKFEKPTYVNSIRVKVKIGQQTLLIPIQPADQDKNISWLFQQVKERYFSMFLMLPTLTLSTQDGIILCSADTIRMILQDNDVLTANVSAWERPRLEDRYIQACKLCLANANTNIVSSLQKADQSGQLQLSDMGLGLSYLQPVFQALDDHKVLTDLRLNGNRLGDAGIESLMKLVPSLPHLKILFLETNGISADGVQTMAAALKSDPCLQHLSSLSLSHNCLDDIAAEALACVVRGLPNLCQLSLSSCNFSHKLFSSSSLGEALKGRRIEHMNISENNLGPEGIKDLLLGLDPVCLRQLNVSHTCSMSGQEISPYFHNFVSRGVCCLQELLIAGNHLSPSDVTFINRLPVLVKSLRCLVLSQNQNVNNKSLQKLLYLSADKDSSLCEVMARGCSVVSPLESELLDALRSKMSSSVPLKKFVFTCRGIKVGDSQVLEGIWFNTWKDQGQVKVDGMTVFMTVV